MKEEEILIDFQSLKKELTVTVAIMSIRNFKVTVMHIAFNWGRLSEITMYHIILIDSRHCWLVLFSSFLFSTRSS